MAKRRVWGDYTRAGQTFSYAYVNAYRLSLLRISWISAQNRQSIYGNYLRITRNDAMPTTLGALLVAMLVVAATSCRAGWLSLTRGCPGGLGQRFTHFSANFRP